MFFAYFWLFSLAQSQSKSFLAHQSSASQIPAGDLPEQADNRAVLKTTFLAPSPTRPSALLAADDVLQTDQNQSTSPEVLDDQMSSAVEVGVRSPDLPYPEQEQLATPSTKRYSVRSSNRR